MPTYEYECQKCRKHTDVRQEITAKPLRKCATCGGRLKRIIGGGGGGGLLFKGSGFYITDYRSANYKAGEKAEKSKGSSGTCAPSSDACSKPNCPKKD